MLQNVLIRIKERNLLDGTRNRIQTRKATTLRLESFGFDRTELGLGYFSLY